MTTEISTRKIMSQRQIGGSDLPPLSHERWLGNMGTGTDFWELISILLPRPTQERKIQVLQQCISYFVYRR